MQKNSLQAFILKPKPFNAGQKLSKVKTNSKKGVTRIFLLCHDFVPNVGSFFFGNLWSAVKCITSELFYYKSQKTYRFICFSLQVIFEQNL